MKEHGSGFYSQGKAISTATEKQMDHVPAHAQILHLFLWAVTLRGKVFVGFTCFLNRGKFKSDAQIAPGEHGMQTWACQ